MSSTRSQARLYDMSIPRAAAEIEPLAAICSRSSILPGPIRPSGSRLMRRLSEGMVYSRFRQAAAMAAVSTRNSAGRASSIDFTAQAGGHIRTVKADGLDYAENFAARRKAQHFERLACNSRQDSGAVAVDTHFHRTSFSGIDAGNSPQQDTQGGQAQRPFRRYDDVARADTQANRRFRRRIQARHTDIPGTGRKHGHVEPIVMARHGCLDDRPTFAPLFYRQKIESLHDRGCRSMRRHPAGR